MLLHNPDKAAHPGYPYRPTSNETFTVLWFLRKAEGGNKLSLFTMHSSLLSQVPWNRLQKALVLASISFLFVGLPIAKASRHCFPKRPLVLSSGAQRTIQEGGYLLEGVLLKTLMGTANSRPVPCYCVAKTLVRPFPSIFQKSRPKLNIAAPFPHPARECTP